MTRTPRRLALAAGAALLLLTGCGDNGEARPGAAAVVGETSVSTDDLQGLVERGLSDPQAQEQFGANRVEFQRQALTRLINAEVLEQAAADNDVTATDGDVAARLADLEQRSGGREALLEQAAQNGIAAEDLELFVRSVVLDQKLGDALTESVGVPEEDLRTLYTQNIAQYDQARTRHILLEDEATARQVLADVTADRSRFAEIAAELSIDTSNKDSGGELGLAGPGQFVPEFEKAVFGAEVGDVVLVQTQFGWHVVEVQERQTTSFEEAEPELRRASLQEERQSRVAAELKATAARLGVTVNPRFGAWDSESGSIIATDSPSGVVSPGPDDGTTGGSSGESEAPPAPTESPAAQ